ncbi:hypothetical protein EUGRSUZ_J00328 [Eucalyptus grandis]|uniref:Uncharacterized protein n=2 Tax=Eucalyptus grandis TaxID=71139 RepID=A0A059AAE1_EUCGR|nr:hypothetical protein EUGRSUZ_J00328 [Eucalyptus grandis]
MRKFLNTDLWYQNKACPRESSWLINDYRTIKLLFHDEHILIPPQINHEKWFFCYYKHWLLYRSPYMTT